MLRFLALMLATIAVSGAISGCSGKDQPEAPGSPAASASAAPDGTQTAQSAPKGMVRQADGTLKVSEENDVYSFEYSYPGAAGSIPELSAVLDRRMSAVREAHIAMAIDGRADADANKYPFNPYAYTTKWEVVADLPGWLSLSAEHWEFTGGAHGNSSFDTLLWDKQAKEVRMPVSLFSSAKELEAAVQPELCDLLDKQRAEKRGEKVVRDQGNWMNACIGLQSATVILGSSNRRTFDRIGFLIPPYEAGPYVEGSYEVTLTVSRAILATVKPEFRGSFSAVR